MRSETREPKYCIRRNTLPFPTRCTNMFAPTSTHQASTSRISTRDSTIALPARKAVVFSETSHPHILTFQPWKCKQRKLYIQPRPLGPHSSINTSPRSDPETDHLCTLKSSRQST